ncbi:hypothetical protein [Leptospira borgpetersenii]|uniref:Uncharacterized protein n=1 Tax=Leptospira borgpetersenii serovar Pomona str. 200901868 TaxID=1192866 RepID=M6WBG4_LEPBO|nr:hypothetical protein [Leptospira borgpetersenii]EMO62529.1 hypothetical protein LEP1GSC133_1710 [Leptospira borgpetersenii serovar Pomona str. 200901868]
MDFLEDFIFGTLLSSPTSEVLGQVLRQNGALPGLKDVGTHTKI